MHILLAVISATALWAWAVAHQLAIYYVLAVMIERLPPPDASSGKFYAYFYSVLQAFAANSRRTQDAVVTARAPKLQEQP